MTQLKRTVKKHFCDMLSYTLHFFLLALGDNPRDTKRACLHTSYSCCSRRQFHGVIDPSYVTTKQRKQKRVLQAATILVTMATKIAGTNMATWLIRNHCKTSFFIISVYGEQKRVRDIISLRVTEGLFPTPLQ